MSFTKAADPLRRRLLARMIAVAAVIPLALLRSRPAQSATLPLIDPSDPAARRVNYVPDASRAKSATKGNSCASCGLYQGAYGSQRGPCQLFPGKDVPAGAWCSSWEPQM